MNAPLDIKSYMLEIGQRARAASREVARADTAAKNRALIAAAKTMRRDAKKLLAANAEDVKSARAAGEDAAFIDRLTLTEKTIEGMAEGLEQVAKLPHPVGEISELKEQPSGIKVGRMRVPLGVIGIVYESRPNVTADAAALCLKAGNACILRGGSEAVRSNLSIAAWRQGPDRAGDARVAHPDDQAPGRGVPRLYRRPGRRREGDPHRRQREDA